MRSVGVLSLFLLAACGSEFKGGAGGSDASGGSDTSPGGEGGAIGGEGGATGGTSVTGGTGATGGTDAGGGTAGSAGSGGTANGGSGSGGRPTVTDAYVYWTSTEAGLVQTLDPTTGDVLRSKSVPAPDPAATPAWTMRSFVPLRDGTSRVLWSRAVGAAEVWTLDADFERIASKSYLHLPPAGFGSAYRALGDSTARLVWHDLATNTTDAWILDAAGNQQGEPIPYPKQGTWIPVHYATALDGSGLLLWAGAATDGSPSGVGEVWRMTSDSPPSATIVIETGTSFWARSLTQETEDSVQLGLGAAVDGTGEVCGLAIVADATITKPTEPGWGVDRCKSFTQQGMVFRGYASRPVAN